MGQANPRLRSLVQGKVAVTVGIVDIGIGNIGSLRNAVDSQGWDVSTVSTGEDLSRVTHLLLPGVGAFSAAMGRLESTGLDKAINEFARAGNPVMGICLGMQLLADSGTEGGVVAGLGLIPGDVRPIQRMPGFALPHVGWNEVMQVRAHPLLKGIRADVDFYFVHGYRFVAQAPQSVIAETDYCEKFPSIIGMGNVLGVQFHPEKSQVNGLRLIDNFCLWDGKC